MALSGADGFTMSVVCLSVCLSVCQEDSSSFWLRCSLSAQRQTESEILPLVKSPLLPCDEQLLQTPHQGVCVQPEEGGVLDQARSLMWDSRYSGLIPVLRYSGISTLQRRHPSLSSLCIVTSERLTSSAISSLKSGREWRLLSQFI